MERVLMDKRWKVAGDFIHELSREIDLEHTFQSQVDVDDIVKAILYPGDREPLLKRLPTRDRYTLGGFISTAIRRARDFDPFVRETKNETAVNIHRNLVSVYGEGCMSIQMVRRWRSWFLEGRQNVHDDERSDRPVTATDNAAVAAVRNVVEANRRVTIDK
ncbi:hypothetical protein LAZ67_1004072 [Cordylochernes scorpioides]|uniref:Uncharacterized protein n=1 Tax=Cordylochernes scorpioides TaxID=51811 RepID=A0ABY6JX79_9ARAC|nr:hypothetical protein LAZ67_1004072 [Cordylochernes scorpioides]